MTRRIGLLATSDDAFSRDLLAALDAEADITAEPARIGATPEGYVSPYDLLIDRASGPIPCYRSYLKAAGLAGTPIVDDPFQVAADDKFFALSLAARLGLAVPRTVLLPQNRYPAAVEASGALSHLQFPLDWGSVGHYVGYPAVLSPVALGSARGTVVTQVDALWRAFDATGESVCMLQQQVAGPRFELICVGAERVFTIGPEPLDGALGLEAEHAACRISAALGYQLNRLEVVVSRSGLLVTDASEPFPQLSPQALGGQWEALVQAAAACYAGLSRSSNPLSAHHRWGRALDR